MLFGCIYKSVVADSLFWMYIYVRGIERVKLQKEEISFFFHFFILYFKLYKFHYSKFLKFQLKSS